MLRAILALLCRDAHWFGWLGMACSGSVGLPRAARHSGVRRQQRAALKRRRQKRSRR